MKIVRMTIILGTLALAGLAGGSDRGTLHAAACGLTDVANVLSGTPGGGTCQR
jgi:hypothetical protein